MGNDPTIGRSGPGGHPGRTVPYGTGAIIMIRANTRVGKILARAREWWAWRPAILPTRMGLDGALAHPDDASILSKPALAIPIFETQGAEREFAVMSTLPTAQTLRALDGVNLFVAAVLAGFGPFVAVFLGDRGWSQQDIGFVLSAAGITGLLSQIPGGELLDVTRSKRLLVGAGTLMLAGGALIIAIRPRLCCSYSLPWCCRVPLLVFSGRELSPSALESSVTPALAERLGRNQRFKSTGSLLAAAVMGAIGYFLSDRMIFFATAALALPTLLALMRIHAADIHFGRSVGAPDHHEPTTAAKSRTAVILEKSSAANLRRLLVPVPGGRRLDTAARWRNAGT